MKPKAKTIDEYLATLDDAQREALERLRKTIKAAVPKAEECISYSLPAFRHDGRLVVSFGAATKHCSFYPMSGTAIDTYKMELKGFDTSKGTIRFQPDKPIPAAVIRKIVKARLAENRAKNAGRVAGA